MLLFRGVKVRNCFNIQKLPSLQITPNFRTIKIYIIFDPLKCYTGFLQPLLNFQVVHRTWLTPLWMGGKWRVYRPVAPHETYLSQIIGKFPWNIWLIGWLVTGKVEIWWHWHTHTSNTSVSLSRYLNHPEIHISDTVPKYHFLQSYNKFWRSFITIPKISWSWKHLVTDPKLAPVCLQTNKARITKQHVFPSEQIDQSTLRSFDCLVFGK